MGSRQPLQESTQGCVFWLRFIIDLEAVFLAAKKAPDDVSRQGLEKPESFELTPGTMEKR
jgi:hypothetical protein